MSLLQWLSTRGQGPLGAHLTKLPSKMILNMTKQIKTYIFLILISPLNNSFFFFEEPTVLKNLKIWGCVILKVWILNLENSKLIKSYNSMVFFIMNIFYWVKIVSTIYFIKKSLSLICKAHPIGPITVSNRVGEGSVFSKYFYSN